MSDEKKVTDQAEDAELNELLDSALKDFDKPAKAAASKKEDGSSASSTEMVAAAAAEGPTDDSSVEEVWIEDFVKQAADQFQRNFDDLMHNDNFKKMAQGVIGSMTDAPGASGEDVPPDFQSAINQALKDLTATSENIQNMPNISEADLASMFGQTSLEDGGGGGGGGTDFLPFMQGMVQSLISKEVLYPSLKDLVDRYPAWLTEKGASLPPADLAKYEKQLELMKKVCHELESEKEDDSEQVKKKRFESKLALMQEMQTYGQPPDDLMSEQQQLFQLDAEEAEKCCVM